MPSSSEQARHLYSRYAYLRIEPNDEGFDEAYTRYSDDGDGNVLVVQQDAEASKEWLAHYAAWLSHKFGIGVSLKLSDSTYVLVDAKRGELPASEPFSLSLVEESMQRFGQIEFLSHGERPDEQLSAHDQYVITLAGRVALQQ